MMIKDTRSHTDPDMTISSQNTQILWDWKFEALHLQRAAALYLITRYVKQIQRRGLIMTNIYITFVSISPEDIIVDTVRQALAQ